MPRRDPFLKNQYYHIYNRWLKKSKLFFSFKDFQRFLFYIWEWMEKYRDSIGIVAYCILPNHFHFVILNKEEWLQLSNFMSRLTSSYAKYMWTKYGSQTWLRFFESRFKAKLLDNQEYLDQCIHYVEFNPVKHALTDNIENRLFTSYDKNSKKTSPNQEILALDWEFV